MKLATSTAKNRMLKIQITMPHASWKLQALLDLLEKEAITLNEMRENRQIIARSTTGVTGRATPCTTASCTPESAPFPPPPGRASGPGGGAPTSSMLAMLRARLLIQAALQEVSSDDKDKKEGEK